MKVKDINGNVVYEGDFNSCCNFINTHETGAEVEFIIVKKHEEKHEPESEKLRERERFFKEE